MSHRKKFTRGGSFREKKGRVPEWNSLPSVRYHPIASLGAFIGCRVETRVRHGGWE